MSKKSRKKNLASGLVDMITGKDKHGINKLEAELDLLKLESELLQKIIDKNGKD